MNIEPAQITIRSVVTDYSDDGEGGVVGLAGNLNIRPAFQREFVYDQKERDAVVRTVMQGYPLNSMYWAAAGDGRYEVLDGQQRTISICRYVAGDFSIQLHPESEPKCFHSLTDDERERFLDYHLLVYKCYGTASEKLAWFRTINIAGKTLKEQEMRNATYQGPWLADAKKWFSRRNCPAKNQGSLFLKGEVDRQDYLETAIMWACGSQKPKDVEEYMSRHQLDPNSNQLWMKFDAVTSWIRATFNCSPARKQVLQSVNRDWGWLYDRFHDRVLDTQAIERDTRRLILDDDVSNAGIIPYLLTGDEHWLSIRAFTPAMKLHAYEAQGHRCANPNCPSHGRELALDEMEADHITPWSDGGKTVQENCQMLCRDCNRRKSDN